jgi:hypothetical protein
VILSRHPSLDLFRVCALRDRQRRSRVSQVVKGRRRGDTRGRRGPARRTDGGSSSGADESRQSSQPGGFPC